MGNDATSLSLSWVIAAVLQSSEVARPKRFELLTPRFVVCCYCRSQPFFSLRKTSMVAAD